MREISNEIKVGDFVKNKLKNHRAMLQASKRIDEFHKTYGKVEKGFDSVEIIRKMRDSRR